jgi:hypothetical protein
MSVQTTKRIAILVHGFAGIKTFMKEIETILSNDPFNQYYDYVFNLSLYNSRHGLDFSKQYDLQTPIYSDKGDYSLTHYFYKQIISCLTEAGTEAVIDIYAHSMGGLVTRSLIQNLLRDHPRDMSRKKLIRDQIGKVFLLGTPNHGTRLAQRLITIPMDILATALNLILEIPKHGISSPSGWNILISQFMQMVPNSDFLKELNQINEEQITSIKWFTVRGLKSTGQLGIVWQPFLFRKFWFNTRFPFLHRGVIPNDGVVDADSVPLKFAKRNITIPEATHMSMLKWKSDDSGKKVLQALEPIILDKL